MKKIKNEKQKMKSKKQPKAKKRKMVTTEENEFYHVKKKTDKNCVSDS